MAPLSEAVTAFDERVEKWLAPRRSEAVDHVMYGISSAADHALLWIGLFAVARGRPLRWLVVVLFHTATVLVVLVTTCAYQYFRETGTTLDYSIIALWLPRFEDVKPILSQGVPPSAWALLFFALFITLILKITQTIQPPIIFQDYITRQLLLSLLQQLL